MCTSTTPSSQAAPILPPLSSKKPPHTTTAIVNKTLAQAPQAGHQRKFTFGQATIEASNKTTATAPPPSAKSSTPAATPANAASQASHSLPPAMLAYIEHLCENN